ncbi:hypothetical protein ACFQS7_06445 [Dankookia sp. GCM10030260]|uniref:hypothetical protein n=1 Tax=Dankookia sp. GCM10030260 TaxID=3273390 RepID=UPI003615E41F
MRLRLGASLLVSPFPADGHTTLAQAVTARSARGVSDVAADVAQAGATIRRLDGSLRAPDARHRGLTGRPGAPIAAFGRGMATAADALASPAVPA